MNDRIALECDRCGAPMKTNQKCEYCGTLYYLGPTLTNQDTVPWLHGNYSSALGMTRVIMGDISVGTNYSPINLGAAVAHDTTN